MKIIAHLATAIMFTLLSAACSNATGANNTDMADTTSVKVEINTTLGSFTVLLYGDTPVHRDNFLKLASEGYYDNTLFHRVISEFMVQAGDPASKNAKPGQHLGAGNPGYTLEAEFVYPKHFHKRGALAAARTGDAMNPEKRSSGSQFYIVTGRKFSDGELGQIEQNSLNRKMQATFNDLARSRADEIRALQQAGDTAGLNSLRESLIAQTEEIAGKLHKPLTDEQRQAYTTVGGSPHLDGDYTVFGEIVDGMDVIDKIEKVETDGADRPKEDIRILSMKVLK